MEFRIESKGHIDKESDDEHGEYSEPSDENGGGARQLAPRTMQQSRETR